MVGVIAVVRRIYARRENAERERKREERASRQVGPLRASHPARPPQRESLPPGYRQHLIDAGAGSGIIKPAGDPT
jgi:hypothetical protein